MRSSRLFIMEGPDGGGKSTLVETLRKTYPRAHYVHFGPLLKVKQLFRCYVEAMMPAVLGHSDVVLDRCWLSEPIYGSVFRGGQLRVDPVEERMLERLAARCNAVVINCLPPWSSVSRTFESRKGEEYLDTQKQLKEVYNQYALLKGGTSLPVLPYDYVKQQALTSQMPVMLDMAGLILASSSLISTKAHELPGSAGFKDSKVLLVGESFAELKDGDPLYQWPFASTDRASCSWWLTRQLIDAGIPESKLCWVNADQLTPDMQTDLVCQHVICMGDAAENAVLEHGPKRQIHRVNHPQSWKRFHSSKPYPLIKLLKELT